MPAGFSSFQVGDAAPPASRARPTCEPCRQRKVRCNRKLPCGHCSRLRLQCVYAKRSRRAPLEAHSGVSESPNSVSSPPASGDDSFGGRTGEPSNKEVLERLTNVERLLSDLVSSLSSGRLHQSVAEAGRAAQETAVAPKEPNRPCGKQLLIGGGERGNYIDESLFAEVLLGDPKDEHPQPVPPRRLADNPSQPSGIVTTDVFGHEVDELCLSAQTYTELWKIYLQNVDPLMKILHVPTAHPKVLEAVINPHQTNETTMALLYAVCFAATATIPKQETKEQLGFERLTLLRYLMHRLDASLTKAKVLMYPNVEALQALVIYLSTLRTHDTSRTLWVIGGIAIRLAESLGVHQDGMRLGLSPFEAETRCRLWWHVGALDSTAPEDHGFDSTVMDRCQSFRAPLNVHDADLFPQMTALPAGKAEWTETTFSLANTDIHRTLRQTVAANRSESIAEQEKAVRNAQDLLWRRWLRLADLSKPVCRAADAVLRIAVLKTLFLCNLRCWLSTSGVDPAASSRYRRLPDGIFLAAVDLLDNAYLLQSGKASGNFSWLFQQRPQLYAFFLALHALKDGPDRPEAERAWRAVDDYSLCLTDFEEAHERKGRTSCVWRILGPLRKKARESRRRMVNGTFDAHRGDGSPESSSASTVANEACGAYTMPDASSEESYESLRQGDPFAMDAMTFDSILAWQDFAGWFDVGQNAI